MKSIGIITATRAEYGLLYPVIKALREYESVDFHVDLIVTGTHLSKNYGETIEEIKSDGIRIDEVIKIPIDSNNRLDIAINQSEILKIFAKLFAWKKYDAIVLLGDRYETMMFAVAATDLLIPIIHLYGGDTTEGALDECIRHSISKMSYLHFPTNEVSRQRIIRMGESPHRVYNYGAPGLDNIANMALDSKSDVLKSIGLHDCKYALCTYHPVTLENTDTRQQILVFLDAITEFKDIEYIITKSNADTGGQLINSLLDEEEKKRVNVHVYPSLGIKKYLSLMKYAEAVIGNSSSGIMEAPFFHIPTVNIGDRQKGRLQAESVINCNPDKDSIVAAMRKAFSDEMKEKCTFITCPYGTGDSSEKIAAKIYEVINQPVDLKKSFYDNC